MYFSKDTSEHDLVGVDHAIFVTLTTKCALLFM